MDNKYEKAYINAANSVLSKHFRSDKYSFDGIVDNAVCLVQGDNGWDVYVQERNTKHNLVTYIYVVDAIVDMIDRIAGKQALQLRGEFYDQVLRKDIV